MRRNEFYKRRTGGTRSGATRSAAGSTVCRLICHHSIWSPVPRGLLVYGPFSPLKCFFQVSTSSSQILVRTSMVVLFRFSCASYPVSEALCPLGSQPRIVRSRRQASYSYTLLRLGLCRYSTCLIVHTDAVSTNNLDGLLLPLFPSELSHIAVLASPQCKAGTGVLSGKGVGGLLVPPPTNHRENISPRGPMSRCRYPEPSLSAQPTNDPFCRHSTIKQTGSYPPPTHSPPAGDFYAKPKQPSSFG